MPKASFWRHISLMETISRMNILLKLQNVDADSLVSLVKRRWDCIVTSIPNDLRSFNQVSLRPEYFSKERIWIWKIVSISVNFLFQIHRGISKNSIQRICAQEVETWYPVETRSIVKGGKDCAHDLTAAASSVRGNIDIYQAVCSRSLISCSLFL